MDEIISENIDNRNLSNLIRRNGLVLRNFLAFIPRRLITDIMKYPKFNINEEMTRKILEEGLYHIASEENVDAILSSGYLKPSKKIQSYSLTEWVFLFAGVPDIYNYIKNISNNEEQNPFTNPTMVVNAVKLMPSKRDLENYRVRSLNDEAIMYQGTCILPNEMVKKVKLVPDLVRDDEGRPIKNKEGEYDIAFREATPEEIIEGENKYIAKNDYLEYISEKAKDRGYLEKFDYLSKNKLEQLLLRVLNRGITSWNTVNNTIDAARMEEDCAKEKIKNNHKNIYQSIRNKIFRPKISSSVQESLDSYSNIGKNPFRDNKFSQNIIQFRNNGIEQIELQKILENFTTSKEGEFLSRKYNGLEVKLKESLIHGKSHTGRATLMAMMIAQNEGVFEKDGALRIMDILSTSVMYHDIGRILPNGPHARKGAKKVEDMELTYLNGTEYSREDKNIVKALIEGHEGKKDKIEKLIKKYKITKTEDQEILRKLSSILRDADALDRVRIDTNTVLRYRVNLNPQYLVNKSAKQMILAAYQLEDLYKRIGNMASILDYKSDERDEEGFKRLLYGESFVDRIKVEEYGRPREKGDIDVGLGLDLGVGKKGKDSDDIVQE